MRLSNELESDFLEMRPLVGTKSLVELHRLAVCRLFGVDTNDVRIEELGVLVLPCPISEIKLLNCTCCGRDVGDGDGAGDALLELGHSDTSDPFDRDILEFRLCAIVALAEDD